MPDDSKSMSSSVTVQNQGSKDLSSNVTIRNVGSKALSSNVTVRNVGSKDLSSSLTLLAAYTEAVRRINWQIIEKEVTPPTLITANAYATILETDVIGYNDFTLMLNNLQSNGITYKIEASRLALPNVWAGIPNLVDQNIAGNGSIAPSFSGAYERLRIQVKNQNADQASRAIASLKAIMGA